MSTVGTSNPIYNLDWSSYLQASAAGAARGIFGLPFEHPFDRVKTGMQANPKLGEITITRGIFQKNGWRGFYTGIIPNGTRAAIKQAYRMPMMTVLPPIISWKLPDATSGKVKTLCGITIANFEVGVINPLERLKVHLMTAPPKEQSIKHFFGLHQRRGILLETLYRGTQATWIRQNVSWVSFLVADDYFKNIERAKQQPNEKTLPFPSLLKVAFEVGLVNTVANMPFDTAKTRIQAHASSFKHPNVFSVIRTIFQESGVHGLYAGWRIRMTQYMVQSVFTVTILEHLEQSIKVASKDGNKA